MPTINAASVNAATVQMTLIVNSLFSTYDGNNYTSITTVGLANDSVVLDLNLPTANQQTDGRYYYNANSSWNQILSPTLIVNTAPNNSLIIMDSFNANQYLTMIYDTSILCGANAQTSRVSVIHNTVNAASIAENNVVRTGATLGNFTATWANGVVQVNFTPASSNVATKITLLRSPPFAV
jgi:hypothetical protein